MTARRLALIGAAALLAQPAAAGTIALSDPDAVIAALRSDGYRAERLDDYAEPLIASSAFGIEFHIEFQDCGGRGRFCRGLLFISGFDLDGGAPPDLVADWNKQMLVGRAFLDPQCDPLLDHYVSADPEMSRDGWSRLIQDWVKALDEFRDWVEADASGRAGVVQDCNGDPAL